MNESEKLEIVEIIKRDISLLEDEEWEALNQLIIDKIPSQDELDEMGKRRDSGDPYPRVRDSGRTLTYS